MLAAVALPGSQRRANPPPVAPASAHFSCGECPPKAAVGESSPSRATGLDPAHAQTRRRDSMRTIALEGECA